MVARFSPDSLGSLFADPKKKRCSTCWAALKRVTALPASVCPPPNPALAKDEAECYYQFSFRAYSTRRPLSFKRAGGFFLFT